MRDELGSRHADLRMMQRVGEFDRTMTEMWDDGIPCDVKYHGHDEARICPEDRVVLLMEGGRVVTILDTAPLDISIGDDYLEEYLDRSLGEVDL